MAPPPTAGRVGAAAALVLAVLIGVYAVALGLGLAARAAPADPVGEPYFTLLEVLILVIAPAMVTLMAALHTGAPPEARACTLAAVVFAGLLAGLTSAVHFTVLVVGREPAFAGAPWLPSLISFRWPSLAYILDILAWDVFFPLAVLFGQAAFRQGRLSGWIRGLMILGGVLALAGLGGLVHGDMRVRNIGVVGYALVFPLACLLIARRLGGAPDAA